MRADPVRRQRLRGGDVGREELGEKAGGHVAMLASFTLLLGALGLALPEHAIDF